MTQNQVELNWVRQNEIWDKSGTIAEQWIAEHEGYVLQIDHFNEESGGDWAFFVSYKGNYVKGGENMPADSFEDAEAAIIAMLAQRGLC